MVVEEGWGKEDEGDLSVCSSEAGKGTSWWWRYWSRI